MIDSMRRWRWTSSSFFVQSVYQMIITLTVDASCNPTCRYAVRVGWDARSDLRRRSSVTKTQCYMLRPCMVRAVPVALISGPRDGRNGRRWLPMGRAMCEGLCEALMKPLSGTIHSFEVVRDADRR